MSPAEIAGAATESVVAPASKAKTIVGLKVDGKVDAEVGVKVGVIILAPASCIEAVGLNHCASVAR